MRWVSAVRARLRLLFHRSRLDTEMDAELHFHLDQQVAENEATGLSPREARRRALMVFGGVDSVKESCRDQRGLRFLEETVRDVRHGVRLFARSPALHGVAALTLALGIGANTAIFSVVHSVLLAELPFEEPERLVTLWENNPNGIRQNLVSPPNFNDWRATSTTFESLAAIVETDFVLTGRETPERIRGASVSPGFFDTLGLTAVRGRTFMATDVQPDADPTVVVSEAYWRRRGEDPGLVGTVVTLQDRPRVIVGVVSQAAALSYVSRVTDTPVGAIDMWEPVTWSETSYGRSAHFLRVVGRLHPQTSLTEATAEMDTIGTRLAETYPDSNEEWGVTLEPLQQRPRWKFDDRSTALVRCNGSHPLDRVCQCRASPALTGSRPPHGDECSSGARGTAGPSHSPGRDGARRAGRGWGQSGGPGLKSRNRHPGRARSDKSSASD